MDRFHLKAGYHFWQVLDRENPDHSVANFSARGKGDQRANAEARAFAEGINEAYYGRELHRAYETLPEAIASGRGRDLGIRYRCEDIALLAEERSA